MKDEIVTKCYNRLRLDHLNQIKEYFEKAKQIDNKKFGKAPRLVIKSFYCIVKNPNRKYNINKTVKQDSIDLSYKEPEFDIRGLSVPYYFKEPDEKLFFNWITPRLEKISRFGYTDYSVKGSTALLPV